MRALFRSLLLMVVLVVSVFTVLGSAPAAGFETVAHLSPMLSLDNAMDRDELLAFYDFPLIGVHPHAFLAARAGRCAEDQDAFWEYHDRRGLEGALGEKFDAVWIDQPNERRFTMSIRIHASTPPTGNAAATGKTASSSAQLRALLPWGPRPLWPLRSRPGAPAWTKP